MPEEGENILAFQNHQKQMKAPYVIYADFEALVKKIQRCERDPEKNTKVTQKRPSGMKRAGIHTLS